MDAPIGRGVCLYAGSFVGQPDELARDGGAYCQLLA